MPSALVHHSGPVTDLAALHDALGCAAMAAVQAWRGDRDSASRSLAEAYADAEEAFGPRSPELMRSTLFSTRSRRWRGTCRLATP